MYNCTFLNDETFETRTRTMMARIGGLDKNLQFTSQIYVATSETYLMLMQQVFRKSPQLVSLLRL